jgi:acetylornithine deacetylase/succinyl-diaminopimelate desuccinylase family protein
MSGTGIDRQMTDLEKAVLANISIDEIIDLTRRLVAFKTENPPCDYTAISRFIAKEFENADLEVKKLEGQQGKPNIVARWKGEGGSKEILLLSGHMDVVPAGTGWAIPDPFDAVVRDGFLVGRGTADMKGALAAQLLAYKALRRAGARIRGDLYLFATVDDEIAGQMGLKYVIEEGLKTIGWEKPTFHILGESSKLDLCVAFKGRMWVRMAFKGRSAHGGNPQAGVNAIVKAMEVIPEILKLERLSHPLMGTDTINIGTIQGGTQTNVVPDHCVFTVDYRYVGPQRSVQIEAKLKEAVARVAASDPGVEMSEFTVFERREPVEVDQDNRYLQALKALTEETIGRRVSFDGILSAGDAYWTVSNSIPAVFYGPGDLAVAHTNREQVPLDMLEAAARIFALYALRMLR